MVAFMYCVRALSFGCFIRIIILSFTLLTFILVIVFSRNGDSESVESQDLGGVTCFVISVRHESLLGLWKVW